jgi:hypothetical protein
METRESSKQQSARLSIWEKIAKQEKENDYKLSKTVLEQIVKEAFDVFDPEGVGSIWKGYVQSKSWLIGNQ